MKHNLMPRTGKHDWQHPVSRDMEDIDCNAKACIFNLVDLGKCGVPSKCKIGDDGRCQGFLQRPQKKEPKQGD